MSAPTLPTPVTSELRFAWRVDYFATAEDAGVFADAKRAEGFTVGPQSDALNYRSPSGTVYPGVYGVHWCDRPGEGWYG